MIISCEETWRPVIIVGQAVTEKKSENIIVIKKFCAFFCCHYYLYAQLVKRKIINLFI